MQILHFLRRIPFIFIVLFFILCGLPQPALLAGETKPFDHSQWTLFLKQYVNEKGDVNYAAVKKNPEMLKQYLRALSKGYKDNFEKWPREERMAFWMNFYHAGLIDQVVRHYPVKQTGEIPNFWNNQMLVLDKSHFSLDSIRTIMLLQTFREVKIHMALSWAARGGPRLKQEAFSGLTVEGQIYLATKEWVNNPDFVRIIPGKKKIEISKIFKWYQSDFLFNYSSRGKENEQQFNDLDFSVLSFLAYYLEDTEKIRFLEDSKYKIKYLPFDWTLNDWTPSK